MVFFKDFIKVFYFLFLFAETVFFRFLIIYDRTRTQPPTTWMWRATCTANSTDLFFSTNLKFFSKDQMSESCCKQNNSFTDKNKQVIASFINDYGKTHKLCMFYSMSTILIRSWATNYKLNHSVMHWINQNHLSAFCFC